MKKFVSENSYYFKNMLLVFGMNAFLYFIIKYFIHDYNLISSFLDDKIPFVPLFILIYMIWYPYLFVCYYFVYKNSITKFDKLIRVTVISLILAFICFIFYPTMVTRPIVDSYDSLIMFIVYLTYKFDIPVNCFPSVHCLLSFVIMYFVTFDKDMNKIFRALVFIISFLIVLSTLFVKQHVIIDVIGAFVISTILYFNTKNIHLFK